MNPLEKQLCRRLVDKGITEHEIPGLMRELEIITALFPELNHEEISQKLEQLGWINLDIDFFTFQLAAEVFESSEKPGTLILTNVPGRIRPYDLMTASFPA